MKVYYDKENRRLIYIEEEATLEFWNKHWDTKDFKEIIERGKNNRFVLRTLRKYLPHEKGKILEGGCGRGQLVYCMHVHGYDSIGVDFAKKTIERIKEAFPELDLRVGDVRDLKFRDNYFSGYWSLGVIEHFWNGYYDILKEMRRVLKKGGYMFLTVPYMSPLRRLKAKLGLYKEFRGEEKENFYQFALSSEKVIKDFQAMDFKLLEKKPIDGLKGLNNEIGIFKPHLKKLYDSHEKRIWIKGFIFILSEVLAVLGMGHLMFFVFRNMKKIERVKMPKIRVIISREV